MHLICENVCTFWLMNHVVDKDLMWHEMYSGESICCLIMVDVHLYASGACCGLMNMIIVALCRLQVMIVD